jgi:hypothetical protein
MIGEPEQTLASRYFINLKGGHALLSSSMFIVLAVERKASEFVALLRTDGEVAYAIRHVLAHATGACDHDSTIATHTSAFGLMLSTCLIKGSIKHHVLYSTTLEFRARVLPADHPDIATAS